MFTPVLRNIVSYNRQHDIQSCCLVTLHPYSGSREEEMLVLIWLPSFSLLQNPSTWNDVSYMQGEACISNTQIHKICHRLTQRLDFGVLDPIMLSMLFITESLLFKPEHQEKDNRDVFKYLPKWSDDSRVTLILRV